MPGPRVVQPMGDGGAGDITIPGNSDGDLDVDAAGDPTGKGAAGDAMVGGVAADSLLGRVLRITVPLVMTTLRWLQLMVLGVGPRMGGRRRFWTWALATPGGWSGRRWWSVGSPVLAVFVASGVGAAPRQSWRRVQLVMLMVRVVPGDGAVDVGGVGVAGTARCDAENEGAVGDDAAAGWRWRW